MIEWQATKDLIPYDDALQKMDARVTGIEKENAHELVWFLEHPPLYTSGTSANPEELLGHNNIPVFQTGRGGKFTYHGPGQRVVYTMLDLNKRGKDLRKYIQNLESWIILALKEFEIEGRTDPDRIGIWVTSNTDGTEKKIGAIGVRVRRWITFHGAAINVHPNLDHFSGIIPCGISQFGVTSLKAEGIDASLEDLDQALKRTFEIVF